MITREKLLELIHNQNNMNISLFLPMEIKGDLVKQNSLRFKNYVGKITQNLKNYGTDDRLIESLIRPLKDMISNDDFWQHQKDGLAVYRNANILEIFRCPVRFGEQIYIGPYFQITPLISLAQENQSFYLLTLNKNNIQLFKGDHDGLHPKLLENTPVSLEDYLKYDVHEKHQQTRSISGGAIFHGQSVTDEEKRKLINFLAKVESGVLNVIQKEPHPLMLAGSEAIISHYRLVNHYNDLIETPISVNPASLDRNELWDEALDILRPLITASLQNAVSQFGDFQRRNQASYDLDKVVKAAHYAKVDRLFIAQDSRQWGKFDPDQDSVWVHTNENDHAYDLLNAAACKAMSNGSAVFILPGEMMPGHNPIAATFRYQ
ncbi:MAG TPA: hypothetical protein VKA08_09820 [Balneolales bacterium]|nr:hypothetical protein [Balneolales bacterium]